MSAAESGARWHEEVPSKFVRGCEPVSTPERRQDFDSPQRPPDSIIVEIGNTRSVIPAKDVKKIFDPFYTTKDEGTGLGLTIAHQIITAHKGKIGVRSGDDKTVFTIELPVK